MNKKVLITGASGGLGECFALEGAKRGYNLVLVARNIEKLNELKEKIEAKYSVTVSVYRIDLMDVEQSNEYFVALFKEHEDVSILINNAGLGTFKALDEMSFLEIERMLGTNISALTRLTKEFLTFGKPTDILNISSMAAKMSSPKSSVYSASKAYVTQFSNTLRVELQEKGIRVHVVHAGPIRTPFFDKADETGEYVKKVDRWLLEPEKLAKEAWDMIGTKKRELNRPRIMQVGAVFSFLCPRLADFFAVKLFNYK